MQLDASHVISLAMFIGGAIAAIAAKEFTRINDNHAKLEKIVYDNFHEWNEKTTEILISTGKTETALEKNEKTLDEIKELLKNDKR